LGFGSPITCIGIYIKILSRGLPYYFLKKIMTEGVWISSYCLHTEGFPKLLYTTMQRLGIQERLEYEGYEYE
jgi:hypothetical protein